MADGPLLRTKLFAPRASSRLVSRPRLVELLDGAPRVPLTLVSAPAGFGKTTLVTEWLTCRTPRFGWLSLDAGDNDLTSFLRYLVAAIDRALPEPSGSLAQLLRSPQPPAPQAILAELLNHLTGYSADRGAEDPDGQTEVLIVLDDYHVVESPEVHSSVRFLLDHLPPNAHLVTITRADPPLPLSRLRARGQLVEIRADALRFGADESAAFFAEAMRLPLTPEQVERLAERTEGWAAGLKLAALSLQHRPDVERAVRDFSASHRYVLDYLADEVLVRESDEVQRFLVETSILDRLCGPLADAVTGRSDGLEMLRHLERANLFLVALDDDGEWYRYHHLFADLLRKRLGQSRPSLAPALHRRAAEWLDARGLIPEAIDHALRSEDTDYAADLILRNWQRHTHRGEIDTVLGWLNALPAETMRDRLPLAAACCWLLWLKGQIAAVEARLPEIERAHDEYARAGRLPAGDPEYLALPAQLATLRSFVARQHGDLQATVTWAERALVLSDAENVFLRSVVYFGLAVAYHASGDLERAAPAYSEAIRLCWAIDNSLGAVGSACSFARVQGSRGRLAEGIATCEGVLREVEARGIGSLPGCALVRAALADFRRETGDLDEAEEQLRLASLLAGRGGFQESARRTGVALARLRLSQANPAAALRTIKETEVALRPEDARVHGGEAAVQQARVWLSLGDLTEADRWLEEATRRIGEDQGHARDGLLTLRARVGLARGESSEVRRGIAAALAWANAGGREGLTIELLILRSLAWAAEGRLDPALADLGEALARGGRAGYFRLFLDEGEPLPRLLRIGVERGVWGGPASAHAERLIRAGVCSESANTQAAGGATCGAPRAILVEPLSEREREVLKLLAEGLSNREIAERLIVAEGTIKTHVHNIYGKLGVANRVQAITRARELKLA